MSLRDRGRDNEVRHRSKVVKERSSSHAARSARSQPLPGQTPRSADGPDRRRAGFGKRLASRSASSRRKGRQRMGRAPPHSVKRPPSGFRRAVRVFVDAQMVDAVLARRERARKAGDFVSADRLREVLRTTFGVEVLDDVRAWRAVGVGQRARRPRSGPTGGGADLVALEFFFRGLALYVHRNKY